MSTATQFGGATMARGEMMRNYWNAVKGPSAAALRRIAAFFLAFPPLAQGIYYVAMGLWPFLRVALGSGQSPTEVWLAESGGLLMLAIGTTLCLAAYRQKASGEIITLAMTSALGLILLESISMMQGRISALYLIDVLIQAGLVAFWVYGWRMKARVAAQAPVARPIALGTAGSGVPTATPLER